MKILQGGTLALGLTLGVCFTILAFLTIGLFAEVLNPTSELWAVMIGAVIGGGIALAGQVLESQNQSAQREHENKESDLVKAYDLFGLLNDYLANATFLRKHIEQGYEMALAVNEEFASLAVMELSSEPTHEPLSLGIKSMLIRRKFLTLYNEIGLLDTHIKALWDGFRVGQMRRAELLAIMDKEFVGQGKGFQPQLESKQEAAGRHMVLTDNFKTIASDLRADEAKLRKCVEMTVEVIQSLGDTAFRFEFKE
ncbi:hypothetical protein SAMN05444287_0646 [Octadecabacter temperatus]|uniref:Uncharacterized protein n=1 Tax=Octadecabacter temperatus TaxID=1458307 RepID=A0A0K0Y3P8_9RHOB|nr:hypothetical protein [Octadecabacter temperatus]AKS45550.1 hypothetical protein OSB_09920 [Octadecabacter temperatus]SIN95458.1 hypothetical protein SAMN05444287_0646 [Octadecabacter temperatus]